VVTAMAGGAYDQPLAFDLPVVLGTPFRLGLSIGAGATVSASSVGPEVAFAVSASGEWGVQLVAVEVLDALGQPQPGVPIASESGFDWAAVPEPDASSGAAVAALALGACATRRRLPLGRK